jgi:hypothetical protein
LKHPLTFPNRLSLTVALRLKGRGRPKRRLGEVAIPRLKVLHVIGVDEFHPTRKAREFPPLCGERPLRILAHLAAFLGLLRDPRLNVEKEVAQVLATPRSRYFAGILGASQIPVA